MFLTMIKKKVPAPMKPFSAHHSLAEIIKHFTPNWFAVTMGNGITALCLASFPGHPVFMHEFGALLWMFDVLLFVLFTLMWISSIVFFPKVNSRSLNHAVTPFFLGCFPMALAAITNGFIIFGPAIFGNISFDIAHVLWWIDAVFAVLVVLLVPYYMFTSQQHGLETVSAIWLLPFVACEVTAAGGGLLLPMLSFHDGLVVLFCSYFLWGISLPLAFIILVVYFQRLAIHKLPSKEIAATVWLPLGPSGTGTLGLLTLGEGTKTLLLHVNNPSLAYLLGLIPAVNFILAMILFGFATWWAVIALILTTRYYFQGLTFNLSFWSFIFPLGVYTACILNFSQVTGELFLIRLGELLTILLVCVWAFVFYRTLPGFYSGHLIRNVSEKS